MEPCTGCESLAIELTEIMKELAEYKKLVGSDTWAEHLRFKQAEKHGLEIEEKLSKHIRALKARISELEVVRNHSRRW